MDYQAVLRRKKEEEKRYRDINDLGNFDESSRGLQPARHAGPSYPLRRSRSAEFEETHHTVSATPHPFLTPSPHMLLPGFRGDRLKGSGAVEYQPSFGQNSQKRTTTRIGIEPTIRHDGKAILPWEMTRVDSRIPGYPADYVADDRHLTAAAAAETLSSSWSFGTGNLHAANKTISQQKQYREQLQYQMEEQRRLKEERKSREREEEERLVRRLEEQQLRMQKEYDNEQDSRKKRQQLLIEKQELLHQRQMEMAAPITVRHQKKQLIGSDGHRGWTPQLSVPAGGGDNTTGLSKSWKPQQEPEMNNKSVWSQQATKNNSTKHSFTGNRLPYHEAQSPVPLDHRPAASSVAIAQTSEQSNKPWEMVDLEPSVLDEIAQLRDKLRSEQKKQDCQQLQKRKGGRQEEH